MKIESKEDLRTYIALILSVSIAIWALYWALYLVIVKDEYVMLIFVAINIWSLWLGMETLRLRKIRRKKEDEAKRTPR